MSFTQAGNQLLWWARLTVNSRMRSGFDRDRKLEGSAALALAIPQIHEVLLNDSRANAASTSFNLRADLYKITSCDMAGSFPKPRDLPLRLFTASTSAEDFNREGAGGFTSDFFAMSGV